MKFYILAGEKSGDFIGGKIMQAINKLIDNTEWSGVGGDNMAKSDLESLFPMDQISLMGFFEVLPHIFKLKKLIDDTVCDILQKNPQIVITIDSPGFTFRVAKKIKKKAPHIKLVHVVAPSVWAYKPDRAKKYAQIYDHMLTLLPFEPQYFTVHNLPSICIGHPVLEQEFYKNSTALKEQMGITGNAKIITVTAGSRKGEINRHMLIIREALDRLSTTHKIKALFVQADESNFYAIEKFLIGANFDYSFSTNRLKSFAISDCALAKSGTNTLEIAASGTPMIIGYKLNAMTFFFLKMMIKIKYACLINIISDKEIIPEYIQSAFNADNIVLTLSELLDDPIQAQTQVRAAQEVLKSIGLNASQKPSKIAAKIIVDIVSS